MPAGFEPDQLVAFVLDDITPWAKGLRGLVTVAADPYNFLELLAESPQGWRAVLLWEGDDNQSDNPLAGCFVKNRFSIGITCQKGLTINPQESLFKNRPGGAPSLLKLLSLVRLRVRQLVFPEDVTERYVRYAGADPVVLPDGTPLAGYRLRFELTAHPEPISN